MPQFKPEQFAKVTGDAKINTELRRWLRDIPLPDRIEFIKELWPVNAKLAISLVRPSQIPLTEAVSLLEFWVLFGQHNAANILITGFVPMLGEERFWQTVRKLELQPAMEDFLNYYGKNKLRQLKMANK